MDVFDPAAAGWKIMTAGGGFSELVGPIWARRDDAGWEYGFLAEKRHENRQGAVHGGMLMTFADHSVGVTAWEAAGRRKCVTMQLDTHFVSAALKGDFITCRSEVIRAARSVIFMRGSLRVGERVVLEATGVWKIIG